ncbi:MAG: outer membrane protein [Hyphomicrobiaceae bacterium]
MKLITLRKSMLVPAAGALASVLLALPAQAGDGYGDGTPGLWRGLYLGGTVSGSGSAVDVNGIGKKGLADVESSHVTFTPVIGYNFTRGPWIWGIEADFTPAGFNEKKPLNGLGTVTATSDWFGSVRLRGGYAWDQLLIYGTVGLALSDFEIKSSAGGKDDGVRAGFAFGVGAEYAIDRAWTARIEAIGYALGSEEVKLAGQKRDVSLDHGSVRLGLTRRF